MTEPLSLAEAKANLRVDTVDEDELIAGLIVDAREFVERETGLVLVPRMITETARTLGPWIELASWPVTAVSTIRYPLAGVMTALAAGSWLVATKRRPVRLLPAAPGWGVTPVWGQSLPVEIDVQAGYATPAEVPRAATRAMHLLIGHWYANRDAVIAGPQAVAVQLPIGVEVLIDQLRLTRV